VDLGKVRLDFVDFDFLVMWISWISIISRTDNITLLVRYDSVIVKFVYICSVVVLFLYFCVLMVSSWIMLAHLSMKSP